MIFKKENEFIVKSNALIEARYRLNLQESRVILWLLRQIQSEDRDFKPYKLSIKEFTKMTGLKVSGQYGELREITKNLTKRVFDIHDPDKKTLLQVSWLSAALYQFKNGCVFLEISPYLKPHLLQLKEQFTKLQVTDLLQLKSIYSVRILELLKQYEAIGKREISIDELRSYCGIKNGEYRNYNAIKLYIIERATSEINNKTNYEINYREIKESRKIISIEWSIKKKTFFEKFQNEKTKIIQKELRSKNILIEKIMEYGFSRQTAKRFLETDKEKTIENAIKSVDIEVKKGTVKNAKSMFKVAIQEQWRPDVYVDRKNLTNSVF